MTERITNSRLEAFADGIFAIAITLLILEIRVPDVANIHSAQELRQALFAQWPSWFAFFLTFTILLIAWVNHHHMAILLDKTSSTFIYANGLLLLTVVVFPFSTGLLGKFLNTPYSTLPVLVYCLTNLVHASVWCLVFSLTTKPHDLSRDPASKAKLEKTTRIISYTIIFNGAMTMLAVWFPVIALSLVTAAWIYYLFAGIRYTSLD